MSLTPADIHNVAFRKGPIGKRGYDDEQVDAFLDELEHELIRLIEENNELRTLVERGGVPAGAGAGQVLAADLGHTTDQLNRAQREKAAANQAARTMRSELERVRARGSPVVGGDGEQALRVLAMAQRTADDHVGDARREAQRLLSDASSTAKQVTGEARAKADAVERDARERHQEAMGGLDGKSIAARRHIEELKAFESEYRSRLKAHLEGHARDLDGRGPGLEAEMTRENS